MSKHCTHCSTSKKPSSTHEKISGALYTCPMHPEVEQDHPGLCPICGMALEPKDVSAAADDTEYREMLHRFWIGAALTVPVLILAMGLQGMISTSLSHWLQFILATPVVLWAGWPFFQRAWYSVVNRSLNMFSLIALGIGAAYFYSAAAVVFPDLFPDSFKKNGDLFIYFEAAAVITVLVLLGQVLELKAKSQTSRAIKALLNRAPKIAHLIINEQEQDVSIDQVKVGDTLRVKPGEKIPVDGVVTEGASLVDESMITGESILSEKKPKSNVSAGTLNQTGSFLMQAQHVGSETLLARIVQMVSEAQRSRAPIQKLADVVSGYFVPAVILAAILTFIVWASIGPEPRFVFALINAVAVLIIACPCALGLATPMSIMVGVGRGAEMGILIRNAEALEKLEKVNAVVLDKTGTLTEGKPRLTQIVSLSDWSENDILRWAAAVEKNSEHPLAAAIIQGSQNRGVTIPKAERFESVTGQGVTGFVEDKKVFVGKADWLEKNGVSGLASLQAYGQELQAQAQTVICVAIEKKAAGCIVVADPIKASTPKAIEDLHRLGLKVIMLTGDNEFTAKAVAKKLNIDEVHAGVNPKDKNLLIGQLKSQGLIVAMVGDGINDAPALAAADVGIAMGTGTDVAMESSSVTLVKGDLKAIVRAINLSRATMRNIRQNLFLLLFITPWAFLWQPASFIPLSDCCLIP